MKKIVFVLFFANLFSSFSLAQTLEWANKFESSSSLGNHLRIRGYKLDNQINVIMVGRIYDTIDFDLGPGVNKLIASNLDPRFFMAKYSSSGNLVWLKTIGNSNNSIEIKGLTIDLNNNIVITGTTYGVTDVNPSTSVSNIGKKSDFISFIAKYNSSGNYVWAKSFASSVTFTEIATDSQGKIITAGIYNGISDFNPGTGINNLIPPTATRDLFLATYTSSGTFSWVKPIADSTYMKDVFDLYIDKSNNIFIAGQFNGSMLLDASNPQSLLVSQGKNICFFAKFSSVGNYQMAKSFYSTGNSAIRTIRCDAKGNIILSGEFIGTLDLDASANVFNVSATSDVDLFLVKYNASGNFKWGFDIGNLSLEELTNHEVAANGDVILFGRFKGIVDFDPSTSTVNLSSSSVSNPDLFIASYDSLGTLKISQKVGGSKIEYPLAMKLDKSGGLYLFGTFKSKVDFDLAATTNLLNTTYEDNFFVKYKLPVGSFKIEEEVTEETAATENLIAKNLIEEKNGITLYPNPSFDVLNIEMKNQSYSKNQIKIYDFLGREVSNLVEIQGSENRFQVNTSNLARGTYFLMISDQHKTTFIKQ